MAGGAAETGTGTSGPPGVSPFCTSGDITLCCAEGCLNLHLVRYRQATIAHRRDYLAYKRSRRRERDDLTTCFIQSDCHSTTLYIGFLQSCLEGLYLITTTHRGRLCCIRTMTPLLDLLGKRVDALW